MFQKHDLQAMCPHCGNPFRIPRGTFTLWFSGGVFQCNVCQRNFFTQLRPGDALSYRDATTFNALAVWQGPPLFPDKVKAKDGTMGTAAKAGTPASE